MSRNITEENCNQSSAYERIILFNNKVGLTPKAPRYYIISDECYGVYDNYSKANRDAKQLTNYQLVQEPNNNGWKAAQKCYNEFFRMNGRKYIIEPIEQANQLVFPKKAVLFEYVKG